MNIIKLIIVGTGLLLLSGCNLIESGARERTPMQHYGQELETIRNTRFYKQDLLNKSERKLYWKLLKSKKSYFVFAQISLGEILRNDNKYHYKTIMCKRADFCVTDKNFNPIAVIEYNGKGHYSDTSNLRDSIKQTATQNAGLLFVAITPNDIDGQLKRMWQNIDKLSV